MQQPCQLQRFKWEGGGKEETLFWLKLNNLFPISGIFVLQLSKLKEI